MCPEWDGEKRLYPETAPLFVTIDGHLKRAKETCQKRYQDFLAENDLTPDFLACFLTQPPLNEFSFHFPDFPGSSYTLWAPSQGRRFCDFPFRNEDLSSPDPQIISLGFDYENFSQLLSFSLKNSKNFQRYVSASFFPNCPILMYEITAPEILFSVPSNSLYAKMDQQATIKFFRYSNGQPEKFEFAFGFVQANNPLGVFGKDRWAVRHTTGFFFDGGRWKFAYEFPISKFTTSSYSITFDPLLAIDNISNLRPAFEGVRR
jgi:hypothetical protein